jgi:serine/threonine protein kinase
VTNSSRTLGPWSLGEKLGSGGNATVWRAKRAGESEVALKVINTTKAQREPYRRFVQEVEFLRSLGDFPGVLPLLDAHLPAKPSSDDRAWLAMPVATPISVALTDASLDAVMEALGEVAATLARLAERGVGHRDVKPGNLYELAGRWLIGDFGLVAAPDLAEMTRAGKALGPAHYTAYEMLLDAANADPFPADVYSFGKTLFVLATGLPYPPEGHQPASTRGYSIADLRPHPHAGVIDRLIDRATRLQPDQRPKMQEIADDLVAWRELGKTATIDVSDLAASLRMKMQREIAAEDLLEQRRELALAAVRRLQELCGPLNDALRSAHPRPQLDILGDSYARNVLHSPSHFGAPEIVFDYDRVSKIGSGDKTFRFELSYGRGIDLTVDGTLVFRAFVFVGHDTIGGSAYSWESEPREAPVGSVESERVLEEGVAALAEQLRQGLSVFVANLPDASL